MVFRSVALERTEICAVPTASLDDLTGYPTSRYNFVVLKLGSAAINEPPARESGRCSIPHRPGSEIPPSEWRRTDNLPHKQHKYPASGQGDSGVLADRELPAADRVDSGIAAGKARFRQYLALPVAAQQPHRALEVHHFRGVAVERDLRLVGRCRVRIWKASGLRIRSFQGITRILDDGSVAHRPTIDVALG